MKKTTKKIVATTIALSTLSGLYFSSQGELAPTTQETYFAEIKDGVVQRVIVADQAFIDSGAVGDPRNWKETKSDGTRKNYAGKDFVYDETFDAFYAPKPQEDATLDRTKGKWETPKKSITASSTKPI